MTDKTTEALKLAEVAANRAITTLEYLKNIGVHSDSIDPTIRAEKKALAAIREALADHSGDANEMVAEPAIPEWVDVDDYEEQKQEPFDMNDHPPHRLCECRKCMEYFTPLPDCDAFAASGKPIAEQESWKCACGANLYIDFNGAPASKAEREAWSHNDMAYRPCGLSMDQEQESNSIFMEGYRIGLAEMREKCATVSEQGTGEAVQKAALELLLNERKRIAAAIRSINFEGDTGFRPVSEMIAEHKQDPKKKAAIERAEMRKAEQEPVAEVVLRNQTVGFGRTEERKDVMFLADVDVGSKLYAAPIRTKDLTRDEVEALFWKWESATEYPVPLFEFRDIVSAVIAADREKNNVK